MDPGEYMRKSVHLMRWTLYVAVFSAVIQLVLVLF